MDLNDVATTGEGCGGAANAELGAADGELCDAYCFDKPLMLLELL